MATVGVRQAAVRRAAYTYTLSGTRSKMCITLGVFDAVHVTMRDERGATCRHLDGQRRAPHVHTRGRANQSRSKDKAKPSQLKPNVNRVKPDVYQIETLLSSCVPEACLASGPRGGVLIIPGTRSYQDHIRSSGPGPDISGYPESSGRAIRTTSGPGPDISGTRNYQDTIRTRS